MKSIIPLLGIPVLAAFVLTGCGESTPANSTSAPATNSSLMNTNGMSGGNTNMPMITNMPSMNTNLSAGTNP